MSSNRPPLNRTNTNGTSSGIGTGSGNGSGTGNPSTSNSPSVDSHSTTDRDTANSKDSDSSSNGSTVNVNGQTGQAGDVLNQGTGSTTLNSASRPETDTSTSQASQVIGTIYSTGDSPTSFEADTLAGSASIPPPLNRMNTRATFGPSDDPLNLNLDSLVVSTDQPTDKQMEAGTPAPFWAAQSEQSMFMDEDDAILLSALGEKPPIDIADPDNLSMRSIKSVKSAAPSSGVLDSPLDPNTPSFHPPDPQKKKKLLYLEGLRGIAALVVTVHHYKQGTFRDVGFWWAEESLHRYIWHVLWDGTFSVTLFYVLSGRVLTAAFYARKGPIQSLSSAVIRRPVRLGFPVALAMVVNLALGYSGAYSYTAEAARIMHSEAWLGNANQYYLIQSAGDYFIWLVNMFQTVYKVLPSQAVYPCGVIWTIPVEYLGSLFIYLTSYMFVHIPIHRYYVFFVLWFFCWWTMQWNGVFLLGLLIADLAQAGHIKRWKEWKYIWTVQLALVAIFFMMLCVDYVNRPIDTWTLSWQVQYGQLGGTAPWDQPKTTLIVAAFVEILLVEISGSLQWFFSTWPFVMLGKYSFGVYLVHGLVLYSVSTRVWVSLFNAGYDYWSIVVIGFIPYIITVFFAAWLFYYLLDKPSIALGHAVYRWGFVEDWTRENFKKGWDEYLDGWRDWGKERKAEWEWVKGKVCSCGKAEVDE